MNASTLDARRIAAHILALERGLDLDEPDWCVDDVHLWPLYRLELYRLLFVGQAGPVAGSRRAPKIGPALRACEAAPAQAAGSAQVWLVSDGISFATLGNEQVERFCSPLHDALRGLSIDSVLIDRGSPRRRRSPTPTRWWMPMTHRAKLSGALRAALMPDRRHARLVERIGHVARLAGIELPALSARRFDAMTNAVLSLASTLAARMRREQVKAVFVVGYYDVGGYAYVLAANRAGAASIDVQHGVTGDLNMAYADWHVQPAQGFALLPAHFWCWTDEDARVVQRWATMPGTARQQTVVGGHPFMEAWRTGAMRLQGQAQQLLDQLQADAGGRPAVLVTLQPHLTSPAALAPLLQTWQRQPDVAWWLRLHPLAADDRAAIEELLVSHGVSHWNIEAATALPLPILLREAAMHATHSSSTVIEAELLDIPSVVWSDYGEQLFEAHIRRGAAIRVTDGDGFLHALTDRQRAPVGSPATTAPSRLPIALQALLKTGP